MKKIWAVLMIIVLFLAVVPVFAEEPAAPESEEKVIFSWADQGNVQLITVGDCPDERVATIQAKPSGKLIVVEFQILDGSQLESEAAFDFAKENVKLDDFEVWNIIAPGVAIVEKDDGTFGVVLVGTIQVLFDVPLEYDLNQAHLTVCGEEITLPFGE